jgi:hypothetical protein
MSGGSSNSHSVQTGHVEMLVSSALVSFMGGPGTLGKQWDKQQNNRTPVHESTLAP